MILEFFSIKTASKVTLRIILRFPQTMIVIYILTLNFFIYPEIYSSAALYATLYIFLELIGPI